MQTRRDIIKSGFGLAAIIAAGKAPAAIVKSMVAARSAAFGVGGGGWKNPYITDGLVAMWDGEWNAGPGVHKSSQIGWIDCIGGIPLSDVEENFSDNRMIQQSDRNFIIPESVKSIIDGGVYTVEVISKQNFSSYYGGYEGFSNKPKFNYGHYGSGDNEYIALLLSGYGISSWFVKTFFYINGVIYSPVHYTAIRSSLSSLSSSVNGIVSHERNKTSTISDVGYLHFTMNNGCYINAIRVYNRALSAAEIQHNYLVDKARFNLP